VLTTESKEPTVIMTVRNC